MTQKTIHIYTDGSCLGNPGPGGWAAVLRYRDHEKTLVGAQAQTTNNQMELMATIQALEALKSPCHVALYTDSQYVRRGVMEWLPGWRRRSWKTASGAPVKNRLLWERLDAATQAHQIEWRWVKGHNGHLDNERVDQLAREQATRVAALTDGVNTSCDK